MSRDIYIIENNPATTKTLSLKTSLKAKYQAMARQSSIRLYRTADCFPASPSSPHLKLVGRRKIHLELLAVRHQRLRGEIG